MPHMAGGDVGARWDEAYVQGRAPWDIGRPQPAFRRLADSGDLVEPVLDCGCGTGEHTLMLAERGFDVIGIDISSTAIERARAKARIRGIDPQLVVGDALHLDRLNRRFGSVIDSGMFHTLEDDDRARYVRSLASVIVPGGRVHLLCFSEQVPGASGPRRVTQAEIREAFADGWTVESIEADQFEVRPEFGPESPPAWLARIVRGGGEATEAVEEPGRGARPEPADAKAWEPTAPPVPAPKPAPGPKSAPAPKSAAAATPMPPLVTPPQPVPPVVARRPPAAPDAAAPTPVADPAPVSAAEPALPPAVPAPVASAQSAPAAQIVPAAIVVVGSPTALGGHFGGMEHGPAALRAAGLLERLNVGQAFAGQLITDHGDAPIERGWAPDTDPRMKNRQRIIDYLPALASHVEAALRAERANGELPRLLVLGGDCTSHSGAMAGLKRVSPEARFAIAWFDAHGDFNIPETTPSGNVWGMPFAMLCGRGDAGLVGACEGPTVLEVDAALLGGQVLDEQESRMLAASPVAQFGAGMLAGDAGLAALEGWARTVGARCDGLYVAFDLDAVDASEGVSVAMPEPDGLSVETAVAALRILATTNRVVGFGPTATMPRAEVDLARHVAIVARLTEAALG